MVAIKDFEMPKSCSQCSFWDVYGKCMACGNFVEDTNESRFVDCPLVESKENMVAMLDKIRAEIKGMTPTYHNPDWSITDLVLVPINEVFELLDKYKAESEDT